VGAWKNRALLPTETTAMQAPEPFDDLDFDPGRLLDHRYQIVAMLGSGGMGCVYKAFHVLLDAPVALKKMIVPEGASPQQRELALRRFCREARLLTTLRHPNIPRVLDYFTEGSACYLVMDYIEGATLAERLGIGLEPEERRPLPLTEALDYASQLCDVLTYLHSQQPSVVFGDLKPSNVILASDGRAMMVDFGIARPGNTSGDTQPLGTPGYAAPEQYERGWRADPRSDIFALGVLLYEMCTGHAPPPFPFGFQAARTLNPALPPSLEALIERALRFHLQERFQTASQLYRALRLIAQEVALYEFETQEMLVPLEASAEPVIVPTQGAARHAQRHHLRQTLLGCAAAAGVMAVIAGGLLLFGLNSGAQTLAPTTLGRPLSAAPTPTDTNTPAPTNTPTTQPTARPTPARPPIATDTPSPTATSTSEPTETPTPSPSPTHTPTATPTPASSPTPSPTPSQTPGSSPLPTLTNSPTPTKTPMPGPGGTPSVGLTPLPHHLLGAARHLRRLTY